MSSVINIAIPYEQHHVQQLSLFDLVELQLDFERVFQRNVGLGTPKSLSKYLRDSILSAAQVIYERT
jgi:predicted nucleotidyltransferase